MGSFSSNLLTTINFTQINRLSWFNYYIYLILLLVTLFLTSSSSAFGSGSARCFNLCQRSEFGMKCRRCLVREPFRFGKRTGNPFNHLNNINSNNHNNANNHNINNDNYHHHALNDDDDYNLINIIDNHNQPQKSIKSFIPLMDPSSLSNTRDDLISTNYHSSIPKSSSKSIGSIDDWKKMKQSTSLLLQYLLSDVITDQPISSVKLN